MIHFRKYPLTAFVLNKSDKETENILWNSY